MPVSPALSLCAALALGLLRVTACASEAGVEPFVVGGLVSYGSGLPVVGVEVGAFARGEASPRSTAVTDDSGRYRFEELPHGTWTVRLLDSASDVSPRSRTAYQPGYILNANFEVGVAAPAVVGTIVDTEGAPVAGAEVRLGVPLRTVRTDSKGHYRFENLRLTEYAVQPVAPGLTFCPQVRKCRLGARRLTAELPFVAALPRALKPAVAIRGRVLQSDLTPLAGVTVTIPFEASIITDAEGRYDFADLAPGVYEVRVDADGTFDSSADPRRVPVPNATELIFTRRDDATPSKPTPPSGPGYTTGDTWFTMEDSGSRRGLTSASRSPQSPLPGKRHKAAARRQPATPPLYEGIGSR